MSVHPSCLDHLAVLRRDGEVGVVRDVQLHLLEVPGLAEHVGLVVLDAQDGLVDALLVQLVLGQLQERVREHLRGDEAHLAERAQRVVGRVLLVHRAVELHVGAVGVQQRQLGVDGDLALPLLADRVRHRGVVQRRGGAPLDLVDDALLRRGLQDLHALRRGEVQDHAAAVTGLRHDRLHERRRIRERHGLQAADRLQALLLGVGQGDLVDRLVARLLRRDDDHRALRLVLVDEVAHGAEAGVARAHVQRGDVRRVEALVRHAGHDRVEAVLLVVAVVDRAVEDREPGHERVDLVVLRELGRERADLLRIGAVLLDDEVDRVALDAAVVVDALEVRRGGVGAVGEVDARDLGRDRTGLDRRPGRLLPRAPSPHFVSVGVVPPASLTLPPPPPPPDELLSSLPQAATPTANTSVAITASSRSGLSRSFTSTPPRTIQYRRHRGGAHASQVRTSALPSSRAIRRDVGEPAHTPPFVGGTYRGSYGMCD